MPILRQITAQPAMSDDHLLNDVRAGKPEAFARLVDEHQVAVRWQISRLVSEEHLVDDLAQEVFVELFRTLRQPNRPIQSLGAWLTGVARHKAVDHLRRNSKKPLPLSQLAAEPAFAVATMTGLERLAGRDSAQRELTALEHCLALLQPGHRELIDEFYQQGKSSELIAARLGKGSGGVRMMLTRIRQALGRCIRKQLEKWT